MSEVKGGPEVWQTAGLGRGWQSCPGVSVTKLFLKICLLMAVLEICDTTPADAQPGVIKIETYACTSWGAAHQYTMQSLMPKGGQINKYCPIRLPEGTKVDVVNEWDDGYAVVIHRGKTWWVDGERVR
jgi:hypothetical protein